MATLKLKQNNLHESIKIYDKSCKITFQKGFTAFAEKTVAIPYFNKIGIEYIPPFFLLTFESLTSLYLHLFIGI